MTLILLVVIALIAIVLISMYNSLNSLRVRIQEAWAQIDVQLKRRADLIPNLVESVKGYATHESEVFENVTKARASLMSASNATDAATANDQLSGALKSLFAVAEAYPQLRAEEGFVNLQNQLSDTEDKVSYSRQFYNNVVRQFNEALVVFPTNVLANVLGMKPASFFEVATPADRDAPKVSF
jgi:LemA protein